MNNINRTIETPGGSEISVELDDATIPDVKVEISGRYFQEHDLRHAAKEFTRLADDLVDFKENKGRRERDALKKFKASRYSASMAVKFHDQDEDGVDIGLNIENQRFHSSGIQEVIDHLKKVQKVLRKS